MSRADDDAVLAAIRAGVRRLNSIAARARSCSCPRPAEPWRASVTGVLIYYRCAGRETGWYEEPRQ